MARRYSVRGISKDRVYTLKIAARLVRVSEATFRKWSKHGLKIINDKRPYLVRGADLIEFLQRRHAANKHQMTDTQFFCMGCHEPREAQGNVVEFWPLGPSKGRFSGVCIECGRKVGRFCKASDAEDLSGILTIRHKARSLA